jgi:hypothetical protein
VVCFNSWIFYGLGDIDCRPLLGFADNKQKTTLWIAQNIHVCVLPHFPVHFVVHVCSVHDFCPHTRLGGKFADLVLDVVSDRLLFRSP